MTYHHNRAHGHRCTTSLKHPHRTGRHLPTQAAVDDVPTLAPCLGMLSAFCSCVVCGRGSWAVDAEALHAPDCLHAQVDRLAHKYFGDWQQPTTLAQSPPSPLDESLPRPSTGLMRFDGASPAGPALLQAFYRPNMQAKESTVVDVIRCLDPLHPAL